jgi:hypothetical protein
MGIRIEWNDRSRRLRLRLAEGSRLLPPASRRIEARVVGTKRTKSLVFEGKPIDAQI